MSRVRRSLQEVQQDKAELEKLVRAFRGIQKLDPNDPNSFFQIAGFHGEPFVGKGEYDPDWWGGYCQHANVLFPTWHRAYVLRFENALRSIRGCETVTLPFWDECAKDKDGKVYIPSILTDPEFPLDGQNDNPLYSYKLQKALNDRVKGDSNRFTKPANYKTVRYPLSGLVGTQKDRQDTESHNQHYLDPKTNVEYLNGNFRNWMTGTVQIATDPAGESKPPDTYSVYERYRICLNAPSYTIFSNTTSQNHYIQTQWGKTHKNLQYVFSLESPHNAVHLSVGGFYQPGVYNADPILGANGDMGENETAGFDPIFFFHHCFVDYVFWQWQKKHNLTKAGSLDIKATDPGAVSREGLPNIPKGTALTMETPLYPFMRPEPTGVLTYYTSYDLTDIENQLRYSYGRGSLEHLPPPEMEKRNASPIVGMKRVHNINRAHYPGSFVIRTSARGHDGKKVEIGRDAILSRWSVKGCANCQNHLDVQSLVPLDEAMLRALGGPGNHRIEYSVEIQTRDHITPTEGCPDPIIEDLVRP